MIGAWLAALAFGQSAEAPWNEVGWGFGALPSFNVSPDEGVGFGALGVLYRYDGETQPYRTSVTLIAFATTRAVQSHSLQVDVLRVADLPLRLTGRASFDVIKVDAYCGIGSDVTCDPAEAALAADARGLTGSERENFVGRYFQNRYLLPELRLDARYALDPMPWRVEIFAGYRLAFLQPGDLQQAGPYPGSRYAEDFGEGERGFVSVVQVGAMVDNRDNEAAPTRGSWSELSVRAAPRWLGSDFAYVGLNATFRGYLRLGTERLVVADRAVFDVLAGETPVRELSMPGGSQRYPAFGSPFAGRGIRLRRFVGQTLALNQVELRARVARGRLGRTPVDLDLLGFSDLAFVGAETRDLGRSFATPLITGGAGLRLAFARNFVIRTDVGLSRFEQQPFVYVDIGNLF